MYAQSLVRNAPNSIFRVTMSSKSAEYKRRLKENDPEKYAVLLAKAKERNRRNREKRKERWESEPQTRALLQEKETFKEKQRLEFKETNLFRLIIKRVNSLFFPLTDYGKAVFCLHMLF
jgi:hypothetical protein